MRCQRGQAALKALPHGAELPGSLPSVELAQDKRRLLAPGRARVELAHALDADAAALTVPLPPKLQDWGSRLLASKNSLIAKDSFVAGQRL